MGKLDLTTDVSNLKQYLEKKSLHVINCELVHPSQPRCIGAHIEIYASGKDLALNSDTWPPNLFVRRWRPARFSAADNWEDACE